MDLLVDHADYDLPSPLTDYPDHDTQVRSSRRSAILLKRELARQDLNLDNLDQNQVCYRYTTGQKRSIPESRDDAVPAQARTL